MSGSSTDLCGGRNCDSNDLSFKTICCCSSQQSPGNDPMNCFRSNVTINTCPLKSNITSIINNDPMDCFKTAGQTKVGTGDIQNYTKSIQNFISLIPAATK